ncbi:hypothetical protein ERX46_11160 [Brumimicrobium glaciale]|uniref:PH domain-containing protein n=1 Tax=Brumimicrobium glaciale TaxID=200475 RepID=A0A4Q4KKS5_9FLAO|nr:hypothetical protein [Brumimicrobium glaciale]RYM33490.1 hypothetical protein ERX46_11160 [Brumimicrobium glaciale]
MKLYAIRLKKLYLAIALLSPIWIVIPVLIQRNGGHQYLVIFLGLVLLTLTGVLAHRVARKPIELKVDDNKVTYDEISIPKKDIQSININKSGIGISAIEFNMKSGKKVILHLPNLKRNAEKGIAFIEKNLPEIEKIAPVDLLEE